MNGKFLEEYDKILERLEKVDWNTKTIVFNVLAINDKKTLDALGKMDDSEFKEALLKLCD